MGKFDTTKTVCFSGHRDIDVSDKLFSDLYFALKFQIESGKDTFLTGMAKGFDLICGYAVLKLKKEYPHIKLVAVVPCDNQTRGFSPTELISYKKILKEAHEVVQTGKRYSAFSMKKRNEYMVANSSVLICYLKKDRSGTKNTVTSATKKGLAVFNIAEWASE